MIKPSLVQKIICRLVGVKPLSEPMTADLELDHLEQIPIKLQTFSFKKNEFEKVVCEMAFICFGLNMN